MKRYLYMSLFSLGYILLISEVAELLKRIADMSKKHETTPKITTPLLFMYW